VVPVGSGLPVSDDRVASTAEPRAGPRAGGPALAGASFNWSGYSVNGQTWTDAEVTNTGTYTTGSAGHSVVHWPGVNLGT